MLNKSLSERLRATGLDCAIEAARILDAAPVRMDDLKVDLIKATASRFGRTVKLRPNQASILYVLHKAQGKTVSFESLHKQIYGKIATERSPRTINTMRKQTHTLRRLVEGPLQLVIRADFGRGYQLTLLPFIQARED